MKFWRQKVTKLKQKQKKAAQRLLCKKGACKTLGSISSTFVLRTAFPHADPESVKRY